MNSFALCEGTSRLRIAQLTNDLIHFRTMSCSIFDVPNSFHMFWPQAVYLGCRYFSFNCLVSSFYFSDTLNNRYDRIFLWNFVMNRFCDWLNGWARYELLYEPYCMEGKLSWIDPKNASIVLRMRVSSMCLFIV